MNNRAIELYKEALTFAYVNTEASDPEIVRQSLTAGKFAELMVRKCHDIALNNGSQQTATDILEYFGVL